MNLSKSLFVLAIFTTSLGWADGFNGGFNNVGFGYVNDGNGNINIYETDDGRAGSPPANSPNIYVADEFGNPLNLPINPVKNVPYDIIILMSSGDPNSNADQMNPNNWSNVLSTSIGESKTQNLLFQSRVQSQDFQFSLQTEIINDISNNYGHVKALAKDPSGVTTYTYTDNTGFQWNLIIHTANLTPGQTTN